MLKKNKTLKKIYYNILKFSTVIVPDYWFIILQYRLRTKKKLKLNNPITFNEKLQWLKVFWHNENLSVYADKLLVRDYVSNRIGKEYLNELYSVYDKVADIDLSKLPDSFVLKTTHGCGQNVLCRKKNEIDWIKAFEKMNFDLKYNNYIFGREWAYKNVIPKIIAEKYINENGKPPIDYKIFCFHGQPKFIQVDFDRFDMHQRNLYDTQWNLLPVRYVYPNYDKMLKRPTSLLKMLNYASILAENIPFVRVDFYDVEGKLIFGEMTFYPENGMGNFEPQSFDLEMGYILNLPKDYLHK